MLLFDIFSFVILSPYYLLQWVIYAGKYIGLHSINSLINFLQFLTIREVMLGMIIGFFSSLILFSILGYFAWLKIKKFLPLNEANKDKPDFPVMISQVANLAFNQLQTLLANNNQNGNPPRPPTVLNPVTISS